jgi:DNA-binding transcriptional LysR family regulator
MNIFQIETFLAIVKTQSISRAAELLFLSQPTVSHRLKTLEDELNISLIDRRKGYRAVEVTPKGEQFVLIANRWMELWQEIELLAAPTTKLPLNLGCMDTLNANVLSPLYKQIARSDNAALFDLRIKTQDTNEIYNLIENREIDLGLVFTSIPSKNIIIEPLFSEKLYIIRMASDENEIRTAYHPSELDPEAELFFNCSPGYQAWHDTWWSPSVKPYVRVDTEALILDFMDRQDFWAVVPISVVRAFEKHAHIKAYEILYPPEDRICYSVTHRTPKETHFDSIQVFEAHLRTYLKSLGFLTLIE